MAMRIWNKTVYSSAHLTRPLLKPHRGIFAWCVKSVIVNKMLVFCCCFIYIYMYMYLCVYIYYIALAHPVSFAALSPLPDPLVKKQHKNRLVFAYITQFSQLQSDANCPDESILKQSKQNWARLWSTIKRPLNICISEHAPANDSLPPHPTPPQPNPASTPLPSVCRGITALRRRGRSMACCCQFKPRDWALRSNLYYTVIYNKDRFSAGL